MEIISTKKNHKTKKKKKKETHDGHFCIDVAINRFTHRTYNTHSRKWESGTTSQACDRPDFPYMYTYRSCDYCIFFQTHTGLQSANGNKVEPKPAISG